MQPARQKRTPNSAAMHSPRKQSAFRMGLSGMIAIGLVLGIATGLFFGEMAGFLGVIGEAWIALLQMTVLPYLMLSMIAGICQRAS